MSHFGRSSLTRTFTKNSHFFLERIFLIAPSLGLLLRLSLLRVRGDGSRPRMTGIAWVNQSQNALINYYNRNATSTMTNETLAKSYAIAVGSAPTVAFGPATAFQRRYPPAQTQALLRYVAFPIAVIASSLNCCIVRSPKSRLALRCKIRRSKMSEHH